MSKQIETQQMIEAGQRYASENHAAMQRILQTTSAAKEIGTNICARLSEQEDVIYRAQDSVDIMTENHLRMQREMRSIESVQGQLLNMVTPSTVKATNSGAKAEKEALKIEKKNKKLQKKVEKLKKKDEKKIAKLPNNLPSEIDVLGPEAKQQIEETDDMLDMVSNDMLILKKMAIDMGDSLNRQNVALDTLNKTSLTVNLKTRELDNKTKRMIG
jgi:hypothetical protein